MNTTPILRATNIVKKLGGKTILNDVSLDVHKGDVKVVIGFRCRQKHVPPVPQLPPAPGLRRHLA